MKKLTVNASLKYDIIIQSGILSRSGEYISAAMGKGAGKACIVTDDTVNALYSAKLEKALADCGYRTVKFVFPHGEASKNIKTLSALLEFLAENTLTRSDFLIALGGGVAGDLCGFAAAVYLRGIRFVQIPTTLLAAVDSSVGGKTGVDLAAGKNLAGAFHQPSLVLCDPDTLSTLPTEIFADGCAEVIKYGMINDSPLFECLERGISGKLEEVIYSCVADKAKIVEEDEFDTGARQLLNFGHTAGHAIEHFSDFGISHGSAVAIGMAIVTRAAVNSGLCHASTLSRLLALLDKYRLPVSCPYPAKDIAAAALRDKKRAGGTITLVVPEKIGHCVLKKTVIEELENFFSKGI